MSLISVGEAVQIIASGGFVIYPTETFLALGCNPACDDAVRALYGIKRRQPDKPFPLVAGSLSDAATWAKLAECPQKLPEQFWPGPLTILLPARKKLPDRLLNQEHKLALRVSASAQARELASASGGLLTATSANFAGGTPCQSSEALAKAFLIACAATRLPWGIVKQGNNCHYKAPSTLVEPVRDDGVWTLKLIREGAIARATLVNAGWSLR